MNSNIPVNRSVINYIHARNYFPQHEVEQLRPLVQDVNWIDKKFGQEMENFNLIFNDIDLVFSKMIGDLVEIDRPNSGTLRRPLDGVIHFEDFVDLDDWRFVVAMEENEFRTYIHVDGYKSVLEYIQDPQEHKPQLDYFNPEQWEMEAMIRMKPNDVLFYRPWIFHSFTSGILHYYKLKVI